MREYWIVQPEAKQVLCFVPNADGKYTQVGNFIEDAAIPVSIFENKSMI